MVKICIVCDKSDGKYKCPKCEMPYCSLECFKSHKDSVKCEEISKEKEAARNQLADKSPSTLLFTTMDTVPLETLEKLRDSEHLKNLLYNSHLRKLLVELDSTQNPDRGISAAMMEPLFLEFADECLKIIEPDDSDSKQELDENLIL
uniref:Zinc finger HIT domain-containing protein 3 n=1 Tax=Culicoides sonorensis TaxID=179676 RepID=A0A336ME21_CULSO